MNEFMQTLFVSVIPACVTSLLSYFAARNNSKAQIKTISEQNKADIEKLIEQHKIDIEALKEKHKMELELKEKDHLHQIEILKMEHENSLKKDEESAKNQMAANVISGMFGSIFSANSPILGQLNDGISKALQENINKDSE